MPALKYWDTATSTWKIGAVGLPSGQVWQQVIGDGVNTSFVVTHGFGTRAVYVSIYRNSAPYEEIQVDVERTDTSSVTVRTYPTIPAISEFIAVVASAGTPDVPSSVTMDTWHVVDVVGGTTGEPKFQNSWVNYGLGDAPAGFRKGPDGRVFLRGTIKTGSGVVFTLPVGYRPPNIVRDTVVAYSASYGAAQAVISSDGTIQIINPGSLWTSLNGIEFDTESILQIASVAAQPLDAWHLVDVVGGTTGEPKFQNSWVNFDVARPARFRKYPDGRVRLAGAVKTGTVPSAIFTLPVGYRPSALTAIPVSSNGVYGQVLLYTTGVVEANAGQSANFLLDGVEFDTELVTTYATGALAAATGDVKTTAIPVVVGSEPVGWLLCDGRAVSRSTYAALFGALQVTYGAGDGSTTFNLPDMRGRTPIGVGTGVADTASGTGALTGGTALTARVLSAYGGEQLHILATGEAAQKAVTTNNDSPDHSHQMGFAGVRTDALQDNRAFDINTGAGYSTGGASARHTHTINGSGAVSGHNTMQPFLALNYLIKT